jgi:hypothetical protein
MKNKPQPKRGNRIVSITSFVRHKSGNETVHETIYYVDTKRRMIWEEYGMDVSSLVRPPQPYGSVYQAWPLKSSQRSLKSLIAKYDSDYDKFKLMFSDYDIQVVEVGVL